MQTFDERNGSEAEAIRSALDAQSENIRVALPGIIQCFDEKKQTVSVQIALRESISQDGEVSDMEIPILPDIPVYFPGGDQYNITYPIMPGMECLVIFADMCIDAWWESGGIQNPTENRRHDLSDGFALVGFRSQQTIPDCYKNDAIIIQAFESTVEIAEKNITVKSQEIQLTAQESIQMETEQLMMQANHINMHGTIININGELVINGEAYEKHQHSDVKSGGDMTGGVVIE